MDVSSIFMKQKLMRRVIISLIPILLFAIYLFGWRVLILLALVSGAGVSTEYYMLRKFSQGNKTPKVSEAVLVTCFLYVLTLPPAIPFWVATVGILLGLFLGKMVFAGFAKNIFNPALLGRCFIFISFPNYMTANWSQPFSSFPGGLLRYSGGIDVVTNATPLGLASSGELTSYIGLFVGSMPGSLGETSALLILLAAAYLIYTRTASWKIMAACSLTALSLSSVLYLTGIYGHDPIFTLLTGGFLFGVVFMATDPISAPSNEQAKIVYGMIIGFLVVIIRGFAVFTEGMMFAILIANTFVPLLDMKVKEYIQSKKVTV